MLSNLRVVLVTGFDEFQNREIYRIESVDKSYIGKWHYLEEDAEWEAKRVN